MLRKIRREITDAIILFGIIAAVIGLIDAVRFPDYYDTFLKEDLKRAIQRGDAEAIEYYNERYVENNRILFEEGEI